MNNLTKKLQTLRARSVARASRPADTTATPYAIPDTGAVPVGALAVRGIPHLLLRSALFAARQGKTRSHVHNIPIATGAYCVMRYTGPTLDQYDLDVLAAVLGAARPGDAGPVIVERPMYPFLEATGRTKTAAAAAVLAASLDRLRAAQVAVTVETRGRPMRYRLEGVLSPTIDGPGVCVGIPHSTLALYDYGWSILHPHHRRALQRRPLALWLQAFYSTHREPHVLRVQTVRELCGSDTRRARRFTEALRSALDECRRVGVFSRAAIRGDKVFVHRD